MGEKRSWKVRWWSTTYNEYFKKSFHYEHHARAFANQLWENGALGVQFWYSEDNIHTDKVEVIK